MLGPGKSTSGKATYGGDMWFFAAFLAIPLIEITLFILVGRWIGLWPTLAIVIFTAVTGTLLIRSQGARALADISRSLATLTDPVRPLAQGAMILLAGAFLITPGFFTDALGLLLLLPPVRQAVFDALSRRMIGATQVRYRTTPQDHGEVIDGDYEELPDPPRRTEGPSGWSRH